MTEIINLPEIKLGSPGEEISKKDLHAISQRFKNLHLFKLQRIQQFLRVRQQVFLELLALTFHQNHPLLPGYISSNTPAGIPDFTPVEQRLKRRNYIPGILDINAAHRKAMQLMGCF